MRERALLVVAAVVACVMGAVMGTFMVACSSAPRVAAPAGASGAEAPASASATASPASAASTAPPDASSKPLNHALIAQGYRPTIYRGQQLYCRYEKLTGSQFTHKVCLTEQDAALQERLAQDEMNRRKLQGKCLPPQCNN
jgi:hypothetical protein